MHRWEGGQWKHEWSSSNEPRKWMYKLTRPFCVLVTTRAEATEQLVDWGWEEGGINHFSFVNSFFSPHCTHTTILLNQEMVFLTITKSSWEGGGVEYFICLSSRCPTLWNGEILDTCHPIFFKTIVEKDSHRFHNILPKTLSYKEEYMLY